MAALLLAFAIAATSSQGPNFALTNPAASSQQVTNSRTLNAAGLIGLAKLKAQVSHDQFSDDPTLAYVSRDFTVLIDPDILETFYDRVSGELVVSIPVKSTELYFIGKQPKARIPGKMRSGRRPPFPANAGMLLE